MDANFQDFEPNQIPVVPSQAQVDIWQHYTDGVGHVTQYDMHQKRSDPHKHLHPFVGETVITPAHEDFNRPETQRLVNAYGGWHDASHSFRLLEVRQRLQDALDKGNHELARYYQHIETNWS